MKYKYKKLRGLDLFCKSPCLVLQFPILPHPTCSVAPNFSSFRTNMEQNFISTFHSYKVKTKKKKKNNSFLINHMLIQSLIPPKKTDTNPCFFNPYLRDPIHGNCSIASFFNQNKQRQSNIIGGTKKKTSREETPRNTKDHQCLPFEA